MKRAIALAVVSGALTATAGARQAPRPDFEALPYAPRQLVCERASSPIRIDGRLDEPAWRATPWSAPFVDILGDAAPRPRFQTRMKMLWDDTALYIGAELEEPDLSATLTVRDSVIFHDDDFEVFIDPDGDTHDYAELEVNALGTPWDLLLVKPYRDGGPPIDSWNIVGLQVGIDRRGTLNHPGDRDDGWTVELALPWTSLAELTPARKPPVAGDHWRINFSRVEWTMDVRDGGYVKRTGPDGRTLPEDNWVWSPQGAVNMHMPERWGVVQFSSRAAGSGEDPFHEDPNDLVKWALRRLYYREQQYRTEHGRYTADAAALGGAAIEVGGKPFRPTIEATARLFEISAPGAGGAVVRIRDDGRVWVDR